MVELFDILARNWKPGIGDPTFMGWLTVVGYFVAAALLLRKRQLAISLYPSHWQEHRRLLLVFALIMVALGINKQLDLQTYVTDVGRDLAHAQDWYENRRLVQAAVLGLIGLTGIGIAVAIFKMRGVLKPHRLALFGLLMVVGFVAMRASSFFKVDRLLGFKFAGMKLNWVLELGAIAVVIWSAVESLLALKRARRQLKAELAQQQSN